MLNTDKLIRYVLFSLIAGISFLLLTEWNKFSQELKQQEKAQRMEIYATNNENPLSADSTEISAPYDNDEIPETNLSAQPIAEPLTTAAITSSSRLLTMENDTLRLTIDKLGGDIIQVELLKHLDTLGDDSRPLKLLEKNALRSYTAQSGLIGASGSNVKSARALFSSTSNSIVGINGSTEAVLTFKDTSGVVLTKVFNLKENSHLVDVNYRIENNSSENWSGTFYSQILRDNSEDPGDESSGFGMRAYLGTATTNDDSPYKKISFKDIAKNDYRSSQTGGWVAMIQHYFVSAWIPDQNSQQHYFTKKSNSGLNIIGFYSDRIDVAPGETSTIGAQLYAGPKDQYELAKFAKHLELTVDYGWFWWLAQPLYAVLYFFATGELHIFDNVFQVFSGFKNWGIAIILLTLCVKAAFFKLSATSYRSMANMRRVQPKMLAIRDKYGNDKQAQSKAMMELYQKEKINPLGGCLPILIQMPVFIALYWALMESVELRHASFLWLNDLSVMDPYFILPIVMGVTMWFQQKMNPTPPDPIQAKVMQWMPVMFTFFFLWFPSGLVIYWVSNNILSIAQQWVVMRSIEKNN